MPNSRHRKKTHAKSLQLRAANRAQRATMRTAVKGVLGADAETGPDTADGALSNAFKHVDKAAKKNLIHRNKAARIKSRLAKARNALK